MTWIIAAAKGFAVVLFSVAIVGSILVSGAVVYAFWDLKRTQRKIR